MVWPNSPTDGSLVDRKLNLTYDVQAAAHYNRCGELISKAAEVRDFLYAALELRLCIERLCFEYLILLTHRKRSLSKKEMKAYIPKEIFERVMAEMPFFERMVDFINTVFRVDNTGWTMVFPDIAWLQTTHGKLGNYLHLQKEPRSEDEWLVFVDYVRESWQKLRKYVETRASVSDLKPHAQDIFDKYVNGEITKEQMQRMIELSNIPIHLLNPE